MDDRTEQHTRTLHILLVEDNEADVKVSLRAFSQAKIRVHIQVTRDGDQTLELLSRCLPHQRPDLILMDIQMPRADGLAVLENLKSDERFRAIPVVVLTTSDNEKDIAASYEKGAAGYMLKPVDYEDFVRLLDQFNAYWQQIIRLPFRERPRV